MNEIPSIPNWLSQLQAGQSEAIQHLWENFAEKLLQVASGKLRGTPRGNAVDSEDVLASVFESIWDASREGRLCQISNVDELLWLLLAMTRRKCIDHSRRINATRRGGGKQIYSLDDGETFFAEIVAAPPDPQYVRDLEEHYLWILNQLPDPILQRVAVLKIEGVSIEEIATSLQIAVSTVQRKIKIIRKIFNEKLRDDG